MMIIAGSMMPVSSHSQEPKDRPIRYVRGKICGIDFAGSKLALKWYYSTGKIAEDKMTFYVPENVVVVTGKGRIFRDLRKAGVVDLIEGDHIIVKYYDDKKKGNPEAISITVLEHDRPIAF
ncbi:MAG: hypothetical protein WC515_08435 [Candidatus Omnitrophota bacterium]